MADPTVLTGTLGTEDVLSGKKVRDVTPSLQHKYKEITPLFRIFNKVPYGTTATNEKVEWTTKDLLPRWAYATTDVGISGSAGATVTLIPAHTEGGSADTERFKVHDVVEVPGRADNGTTTTNIGVVTTVTTDTSIVVDPIGWASNDESTDLKFVATYTNDEIHVMNDASAEYSQKPAMKVTKDAQEFNYIGFLRVPYVIGNINLDGKKYTGPERAERKEETYKDVRIQAEENMIHGKRYYKDVSGVGRQFFMGGFKRYLVDGAGANLLYNWSAGLTEAQWDEYLVKGPGLTGSNQKFLFTSSDLMLKVNSFAKTKERVIAGGGSKYLPKFGIVVTKYLAPDNKIYNIFHHHLFTNYYAGAGLIIDPEYAQISPYGTQGTMRYNPEIQENDRAGIADEWQIIFSLRVLRTEPHGWITA